MTADRIVRRETLISAVINTAISALMFALVFGFQMPAPVRAPMGYAIDFFPQVFMVSLMGGIVPALLTMRRHRTRSDVRFRSRTGASAIVARSLAVAVAAAIVLGGGLCLAFWLIAPPTLSTLPALMLKMLAGAAVSVLITPVAVRHALARTGESDIQWQP